jgi:hypothetical protein
MQHDFSIASVTPHEIESESIHAVFRNIKAELDSRSAAGWELVSTQTFVGPEIGHSFYLFWKKP